jgi:hypothetical protein
MGNLDISWPFAIGALAGPLNVAIGAEYRRENYQIHAGEPDSYGDGGVANQFGESAAIGRRRLPPSSCRSARTARASSPMPSTRGPMAST